MAQSLEVVFHGATLLVVEHSNQPYVPMKPVVTGMGLAWQSQLAKLTGNAKRWGITEIVIPTVSGEQGMSCLPLRKLPGWLATISPNKVRPDLREKVIAYQDEADDVLWNAWQAQQPAVPQSIPYTVQPGDKLNAKQQATLRELLETNAKRLPPEKQGPAIMRGWSKLKAHFKVGYRDIPAEQFTDAVSLLSRHVAELEVVEPVFPSINAAQLLLEGQSEHPLPNDVHTMIDRRAAEITVDAHMLIREHLQRRVSFRVNHYPDTSREQVADVLKEAELGNCLTHAYHSEVRRVLSMLGSAAQMAASSVQRLQAEMNALRPEPPTLTV